VKRACRNLEREIGACCATRGADRRGRGRGGHDRRGRRRGILGAPRFENEVAMRTACPGVATGLAWTPVGGDILFIEATRIPGTGKLILTGQLGDVMKESAQAALSAGEVAVIARHRPGALREEDIHVHVPAGAIPKDGPSAGVAMYTRCRRCCGHAVRNDIAMTGEISLRGLVLPVGGVKEKTLAAHRAGIRTVMLPRRNEKDLVDIPAEARAQIEFVFLDRVEDAMRVALGQEMEEAVA
jgi:ATP-dependent Lon protease